MEKIWMRRARSFSEAQERLEIVQFLREQYPKFGPVNPGESGKGLRRAVTVVQQA
jgi:hypothetical protein